MDKIKWNKETKSFGISQKKDAFLMVYFRMPDLIYRMQGDIASHCLYNEPGYGLEFESHVTLYPCMDNHIDVEALKKYVLPSDRIDAYIINVSKFYKDNYDVLKCDIISNQLTQMNSELAKYYISTSEYKDYHPHMTIAYVLPGECNYFLGDVQNKVKLDPIGYVFSYYDGEENKKITWK